MLRHNVRGESFCSNCWGISICVCIGRLAHPRDSCWSAFQVADMMVVRWFFFLRCISRRTQIACLKRRNAWSDRNIVIQSKLFPWHRHPLRDWWCNNPSRDGSPKCTIEALRTWNILQTSNRLEHYLRNRYFNSWDQKDLSLAWQMHQMLRLMHTVYWDKVDRNIHLARAFVLAQNRVLSPNDLTINFSTAALSMGLLSSASSVWIARDANSDCDICFCRLNQKIKEFKSPWRLDTEVTEHAVPL